MASGLYVVTFLLLLARLATMAELHEEIAAVGDRPEVRVIVLTGAGKAFCTGADLATATTIGGDEASPEVIMDTANGIIRAIVDCSLPVIAQANGPAAGVGASIALAAVLVYAADNCYLLLSFTSIGLMPDGNCSCRDGLSAGR